MDASVYFGRKKNFSLAFDTNILIDFPDILEKIVNVSNIPLLISQQVRYELDNLKDRDEELSQKARYALKTISKLHKDQKVKIVNYNKDFLKNNGFDPSVPDDRVIGSYLERAETNENVVFITNDNNARTTARTTKLIPLELDWNIKGHKRKMRQFRPGYFHTVLSMALFSLGVGFINGAINVAPGENLVVEIYEAFTDEENKDEKTKKEEKKKDIESEYGDVYKSTDLGDWGKVAVVDIYTMKGSFAYFPSVTYTIATNSKIEANKKQNEITYILELASGEEVEADYVSIRDYQDEYGIQLNSVDSMVKFSNVNSYENVKFTLRMNGKDADPEPVIKDAKLRAEH